MSKFLGATPSMITPVRVQKKIPHHTHDMYLETMGQGAFIERVVEDLASEIVRGLDEMGLLQLKQEMTPEGIVYSLELDVLSEAPKTSI